MSTQKNSIQFPWVSEEVRDAVTLLVSKLRDLPDGSRRIQIEGAQVSMQIIANGATEPCWEDQVGYLPQPVIWLKDYIDESMLPDRNESGGPGIGKFKTDAVLYLVSVMAAIHKVE